MRGVDHDFSVPEEGKTERGGCNLSCGCRIFLCVRLSDQEPELFGAKA